MKQQNSKLNFDGGKQIRTDITMHAKHVFCQLKLHPEIPDEVGFEPTIQK